MLSASPFNTEVNNPPTKTSFFSKKRSSANFDSDPANKFASRPSTPPTDDPELEEQLNDSQTSLQPLSDDVLKSLCQFEDGFHLLLERAKQNIASTKEAAVFLKKRAQIEEEYGKALLKLSQSHKKTDGKEGTFGESWSQFLEIHDTVGSVHLKLSNVVAELSEDLSTLQKDSERSRKQLKSAGYQHAKLLHESEHTLEKAKSKYEMLSEEWERTIIAKEGPAKSMYPPKPMNSLTRSLSMPLTLLKQSNASAMKMQKYEDDARAKLAYANVVYKNQLKVTLDMRSAYYSRNLPRFIRLLKDANDQCDASLKSHLYNYARTLEDTLMMEATTVSPVDKESPDSRGGVNKIVESIDNARDFNDFMASYFSKLQLDVAESPMPPQNQEPTALFGIDLTELMERDGCAVPAVVGKCIMFTEARGMNLQGLYREGGDLKAVRRLRDAFNRDITAVDLNERQANVMDICLLLKLFFREMPDPLFPRALYLPFMDAGRMEDPKRRLIAVHELVNRLHDANYATLRALMNHLVKVHRSQGETRMSPQNLAVVWAPCLLDSPEASASSKDLVFQTRVLESILNNFDHLFDAEDEETPNTEN